MRNPRHQLILLGFICQGLSWDDYVLPLANTLVWALCLVAARRPLNINPAVEAMALPVGVVAGYLLSAALGQNTHFFIGHGITFVQAVRLMRPLKYREKIFSILMAFFQIGVACTVILDYRFILIFLSAVWLMPRTLMELESENFAPQPSAPAMPRPRLLAFVAIAGVSVLFFLFFPRGIIGSPIQLNRQRGDPGSLLDNVLDPTRSGAAQSSRIIFSIDGHNVGYLRCYALTDFDGIKWTNEDRNNWKRIELPAEQRLEDMPLRRVRAKSSSVFGRVLPTDGRVVYLRGTFFGRAWVNSQGMMEMENIRNTGNNFYEYRINPHPKPEKILPETAKRLTQYPPQSPALSQWLDNQVLKGATAPTEQARKMEAYLRDNFTYRLGAPELNRLAPVDDFVFNQKEGHCERFASTLALMLRMKGIPSRVVIGYLPMSRNWISGWYDIRFKDAHAWTEAYFKELGWVRLDATPGSSREQQSNFGDFMEAIDFAWYANVVNFDASTQGQLFAVSVDGLTSLANWLKNHAHYIGLFVLVPAGILFWLIQRKRNASPEKIRKQNQVIASHYYGQMLRILAAKGVDRPLHQTPLEFLAGLESQEMPILKDAQTITQFFCASRYGDKPISAEQKAEIEAALDRIRKTEMQIAAASA